MTHDPVVSVTMENRSCNRNSEKERNSNKGSISSNPEL